MSYLVATALLLILEADLYGVDISSLLAAVSRIVTTCIFPNTFIVIGTFNIVSSQVHQFFVHLVSVRKSHLAKPNALMTVVMVRDDVNFMMVIASWV